MGKLTYKEVSLAHNISIKTLKAIKKESPSAYTAIEKSALFIIIDMNKENKKPTTAQVSYYNDLINMCKSVGVPTRGLPSNTAIEISESISKMKAVTESLLSKVGCFYDANKTFDLSGSECHYKKGVTDANKLLEKVKDKIEVSYVSCLAYSNEDTMSIKCPPPWVSLMLIVDDVHYDITRLLRVDIEGRKTEEAFYSVGVLIDYINNKSRGEHE